MVSDKTLALWLYRKGFPQRWKVLKQVKHLLGGERVEYMCIDTQEDSERESCPAAAAAAESFQCVRLCSRNKSPKQAVTLTTTDPLLLTMALQWEC